MRLLVVDDDVSFVTFVCRALEKQSVEVEVALTGTDAVRRLQSKRFAGVLLDLSLPDMHGLDVLRTMRRRGDLTPVVVLTGAGTVVGAVEAMKLGALDLLEKPVHPDGLSTVVHSLRSSTQAGRLAEDQPVGRLAAAMLAVARHVDDVPTVREWCTLIGRSESSLYALCEISGVPAKAALDLARLLRANRCSKSGDRLEGLTSADPRTVERLLRRAGLTEALVDGLSLTDLLARQQLVVNDSLLRRLGDLEI